MEVEATSYLSAAKTLGCLHNYPKIKIGLWELCSKFLSLFYSEFLSKSLHYAQFCSFYAAPSIIIPYLQFKLSSYRAIYSHAIMHKQHNNQRFKVASLLV